MRLLIDAMNLIGSRPDGWWNDPDRAMRALTTELEDYVQRTGDDVTLVFDRRPSDYRPPSGYTVVFASRRGRNAADYEIHALVARDEAPSGVLVVTSDRRLAERVRALGARVIGSGSFRDRLDRRP